MALSIEVLDGYDEGLGGLGVVAKKPVAKPVIKKVAVAPKALPVKVAPKAVAAVAKPKPAPVPVKVASVVIKAPVPVKVATPTSPPKLTLVKQPTVTTTTTSTASLIAAKAGLPKGSVFQPAPAPSKSVTVIGGKTFTTTAPIVSGKGGALPYQPPSTKILINPTLVGGKGYTPPITGTTQPISKSGSLIYNPFATTPTPIKMPLPGKTYPTGATPVAVDPIYTTGQGQQAPPSVYTPPVTGTGQPAPPSVYTPPVTGTGQPAPGTQMPASGYGQTPYNGGFQPYGGGDSYGMTAQQAAEAAADQAAASDPLVASTGSGGGGGAAAEGEAEAAAEAAAEKPGLKVRHVVGGAAVIGVLAYFLL